MSDIVPQKRNVNQHTPRGQGLLRDSIGKYGIGDGITVAKNEEAISGSMRLETLAEIMPDVKIQIVETYGDTLLVNKRMDIDTPDTKMGRALSVASNAAASADWNPDGALLAEWAGEDEQIKRLFLDSEWSEVTGEKPEPQDAPVDIDRAAELLEVWKVKPGDLWRIGEHRLLCGDSTKREDVERVMGGERAEITFTSPPYWVGKDYEYQNSLQEIKDFIKSICGGMALATNADGGRIIVNTSTASAKAINEKADAETIFTLAWYQDAFRELNWLMRHCRVWLKNGGMAAPRVAARSDVIDQHWEVIPEFLPTFYFPDGLRRGQEKIGTKWAQLGVWTDIQGDMSSEGHIAAFPLELPARYIKLYTQTNEIIYEPFAGSGTTGIACQNLGRRARMIEISPAYCSVILQRFTDAFPGINIERIA